MVNRAPRNLDEWVRSIERKVAETRRAVSTVPVSYYEKTVTDAKADKERTPNAPVELTAQSALYTDGVLARQYGRIMVDFPDVTKATDGTTIPIAGYELWGRDDSTNYLDSTTGAVPGTAAPGLTFPGLAKTAEMKAAAAQSVGSWKRLSTSAQSSLRVDGLIPGSVWSLKVRALGVYTVAPGNFSEVLQIQVSEDTTPPPQPSKPIVSTGRGVVTVKWDGGSVLGSMPADFSHLTVAWATSSSPEAETDRYFAGGGISVISDVPYNTPVFIRFQAHDFSGNKSAWSEQVTAITTPLVDTDVILAEIDASQTVIKNLTGEALVDGAIRAEKIANNAIDQSKLADAIIDAAKLAPSVTDQISKGINDAATAQGAANAANTAAGNAASAAAAAQKAADMIIAAGTNLILNGGFEDGDANWATNASALSRDSATARSGAKVFYLNPDTNNAWAPNRYVPSAKGRTFYLEAWFRRIGNSGNAAHTVGFVAQSTTTAGGTSTVAIPTRKPSTELSETEWTKFSTTYTLPDTIDPYRTRFGPWALLSTNDYEVDDMVVIDITESKEAFDKAEAARLLAQQAFDDAQEALGAAGLAQDSADGKATVYYPDTAPAGTGYRAGDIWFRGTDNKVHIWDPAANSGAGGWVAKTDVAIGIAQQAADDAAAAAENARVKAVAAQDAADDLTAELIGVQALQASEKDRLDTVQLTANGKNKVTYSTSAPGTTANTAGDIWFQRSGVNIIGQWEGTGGTGWASRKIDGLIIANIDAGTITSGFLASGIIKAGSITADKLVIGVGANMLVDPSFENDDINLIRKGTSNWTVTSNTADGKYFTFTGASGAVVDLRLDNSPNEVFTADPKGAYSLTIDTDAPANTMQAYLVVTYADGSAASGPFVKAFATDGTRQQTAVIWEFDKLLNANGSPVKWFRPVVRRTSATGAAVVSNIYSARFSTAMTGQMIVDGTITATNIKAGSLTSASGIFGDLNANILTSGTISADRLNAGDVRAKFLAAGKVTAADMVTGTITAASGIIGSLDIGKVTTGELDGIYIKTNTLAVNHLRVSDLANFAPSYAESPTDWQLDAGMSNVATALDAYDGRRFQLIDNTGAAKLARGPYIAASAGDEFYAEGVIYRSGPTTNAINLRYYFYDKDKVYKTSQSYTLAETLTVTPQNSPTGFLQKIRAIAPPGTGYARLCLVMTDADNSDIGMYNVRGYRRLKGDMVVDGTLTAEKVATNTFTAKHIQVGDFANIAIGSDFDDASAVPWAMNALHTISTTQKRSGTASLRLAPAAGSQQSTLVADTRVKEGEEWYFSYWVYLDATFNGTTGNSKIRVGDQANNALKHITYASVPKGSWQKVTDSVVVGAGVTSLTVQLWNDQTTGYAYIDNVEIRRKSEASLIRSLGVEQLTASTAGIDQAVIDKLWADVVNSRKITTDMLVVTGENLLVNSYGQFGDNKYWSDWTWTNTDLPPDGRVKGVFHITGGETTPSTKYLANSDPMPVVGDTTYIIEGWIKADKANSRVYLQPMADNGINPSPTYVLSNYVVPTAWTWFSEKVKTSPGQKSMTLRLFGNHVNGTERTALQKIGGLRVRPAVGADLVVNGSIQTIHLGSESVTASKIKALDITSGHLAANAVTTDKLNTGSVTASKLEATLVLATRILAGPANDTHAEMAPEGFKVFAKDALGNVNEVVRLGVAASNDYFAVTNSAQELVTTISSDGAVSSRKVTTDELVYKGEDMQVVLDRASLGLVAWGQFNGNQLPGTAAAGGIANGTERGLFEIAWEPVGTRMYAVSCSPVLFTPTNGTATAMAFRMRYTTDGSQPTTTSPILAEDFKPVLANGSWTMSFQFADRLVGGFNGSYIRVLFSIACSNGGGIYTELGQSPTFSVKDVGPAYPKAGVVSNQTGGGGGGSRPPVVTRKKYYTALDRRSYLANGSLYNYDTGRMYQGPSPAGVGHLRSMAFFPDMTADLSGATIEDIQVYIYFDHWYNNNGGIAKVGLHGHTGAIPSTFNWVGWVMDSEGWPKPGGRWLRIPSQYWNGFKTGAYRGITLGVNTVGYEHYGIANGSPQIYVQYTK